MKKSIALILVSIFTTALLTTTLSARSGFNVTMGGKPLTLMGEPLQINEHLPDVQLPDAGLNMVDLKKAFKGKVTIVSIVPSIDTRVCEKQTHILSEENKGLDETARLVTISRDLPFAQQRFAREAKIHNILFLSDYREATFGKASGLLIGENRLLARAVLVLDKDGVIRYMEVVPDLGQLPDMERAFETARSLT
ncbi:putative thiol peroxidase [Nitrospina gracilis 3/211]|uniref:Putative thiol peroxidase n=1 Tax=Nitrospina gracilis (strain 3/211) TaxID=1266370 RepID=M1YUT8_NITG3|nr:MULTISPECIES: thiol peroxidase [Nitrospina]MCF8722161.1 thiol peroxidase [Nitrospina sp. Nb-3]CCQ89354.1 putative thiol peroxidase [Nitrospina gracilis 3/211]